ncbi:DUF4434 domain-containing protein [Litchfieldella xinjiangensis]|uniref:DUF4434 domain-containing protein n=1 Tax=Litchfieldella xinjiangensis TaxID=1166948 RepID=UPI0005BC17DA|nr:DUF4434 domain-containing protein [Halomonas xinjiangensis]
MTKLLMALVLMMCSLTSNADGRLFYQPQSADAALNAMQWRDIWQQSRTNGVHTLIVQWTRYGEENFGGETGWLASALREAERQGIQLILGLSFDPAYYLSLPDNHRFATYWHQQLGLALQQQEQVSEAWQLDPVGWYLPYELDDNIFRDSTTREELQNQLEGFITRLDQPLHMSAFTGGLLSPAVYAEWLLTLDEAGINLWWQDGRGTAALEPVVRQAYEAALDCRIGIIREAFRQTSGADTMFQADPTTPLKPDACHETAVFSLRYRPWAASLHNK